jgi:hypothetical protein
MNPMIALQGATFDPAGAMAAGQEQFELGQGRQDQNALRGILQQYGGAAMAGDQNALRAIAAVDPTMAQGLASGQLDMTLAKSQDARQGRVADSGIAVNEQQIAQMRERGRMETEQHAANLDANARAAKAAEAQKYSQVLGWAYRQGPEKFGDVMKQLQPMLPDELDPITYDALPAVLAFMEGGQEALAGPAPLSSEGKFAADVQSGILPEGSVPNDSRPISVGNPPKDHRIVYDERGRPSSMEVMEGSPTWREQRAAEAASAAKDASAVRSGSIVIQDLGRIKKRVQGAPWFNPATGLGSGLLEGVRGSNAADTAALAETIKANIGFDRLQKMREESPTGGALGAISDTEMRLLSSVLGSIEQSQSDDQLIENIDRLSNVYKDSMKRLADAARRDGIDPAKYGIPDFSAEGAGAKRFRFNPESGEVEPVS